MIILPYGDSALLINLDQRIDERINAQVTGLNEIIKELPSVTFTIPAYCSLTVGFDRTLTGFDELKGLISTINLKTDEEATSFATYHIPVCYDGPYAPDMAAVMEFTGLSKEQIIDHHSQAAFRVYMVGFVAGFAYLGSLPKALYCPRKTNPRKVVSEGAVGLAGYQTGIYPTDAPGGWQLIGKTPVPTFRPHEEVPALLKPGDYVRFIPIEESEFLSISEAIQSNSYELEVSHG